MWGVNWAQRQSDITGPVGSLRHKAFASVSHAVFAAIWLVITFCCKKSSGFCFCVSLILYEKTYRHQWARLSVLSVMLLGGAVTKHCPVLELHTLCISLCYSQPQTCVHTQTHTRKHTATHLALSVLPEVNSQTGSNSTDWAEWASLSPWQAFAPRVD